MDYCLRFQDRDECLDVLAAAGIPDGFSHAYAIDHIGELVTAAVMDGEEEVTPAVIDSRHHVNIRAAEPVSASQLSELAAYLVYPQDPQRVWA